jgi:hypothetical protein
VIKLSRVLEIDAGHSCEIALAGCVGDAYLCSNNRLYRRVREECLGLGYRYTRGGVPLWHDYQVSALLCLPEILRLQLIPYIDNAPLLSHTISRKPDYALTPQLMLQIIRRNYVLHESAHCIAHSVLSSHNFDGLGMSPAQLLVRAALASESFANAVEWLTWSFATTATHAFFFTFCSYVNHTVHKRDLLHEITSEFGFDTIFELAFVAFLALNAGRKPLTAEDASQIVNLVSERRDQADMDLQRLVSVLPEVFTLNVGFVNDTAPAYFRFLNCEAEFRACANGYSGVSSLVPLALLPLADPLVQVFDDIAESVPATFREVFVAC